MSGEQNGTTGQPGHVGSAGFSGMSEQAQHQQRVKDKIARDKHLKAETEENEKLARYWKAKVETMKYSMEYESIEPEYIAHMQRVREKEQKQMEEFQAQIKKLAESGAAVQENVSEKGNVSDMVDNSKPE